MTERETLKSKIAALIAKAESTEFEAESAAFMAKAIELMNKHQIDLHELGDDDPLGTGSIYEATRGAPTWRNHLLSAVARYYGGRVIKKFIAHDRFVMELNGSESSRITIELMFEFILKQVREAGRALAAEDGTKPDPTIRHVANAFVARISELTLAQERKQEADRTDSPTATNGTAIITLNAKALLDAYIDETYGNLHKSGSKKRGTSDGALRAAGKVSLHRQATDQKQVRIA